MVGWFGSRPTSSAKTQQRSHFSPGARATSDGERPVGEHHLGDDEEGRQLGARLLQEPELLALGRTVTIASSPEPMSFARRASSSFPCTTARTSKSRP